MAEMFVSDDTATLFTVQFFRTRLTVTVTSSASVADSWIRTTLSRRRHHVNTRRLVVGVGVQWNSNCPEYLPAETLQLCVGTRCLIFQLSFATETPSLLREFLFDTDHTFVGLWNSQDNRRLMAVRRLDLEVHRLIDLRIYADDNDGRSLCVASVEKIVDEVLGFEEVRLDHEVSRSDWDVKHLSDEQVLQASVDAHVSFLIGKKLRAWNF